jgi:predicted nucleic acid-binding protein
VTTYLLDVSVLVALGFKEHEFFERVVSWVEGLHPGEQQFATCAIAELGFVRVLTLPQYGLSVAESKAALLRLKSSGKINFVFLADDQDVTGLPGWVKTPKQITYGHLAQLAKAHGAVLATLDRGVPGALVIPQK